MDGVAQNARDILAVKGRIFLMPRSEIKDLAEPPFVTASATEDLAARKPADKDQLVGHRDLNSFSISFLLRKLNIFGKSFCNGV